MNVAAETASDNPKSPAAGRITQRDQEGRFFHGYYGHYCYLPLYFFCGDRLLCARLREADELKPARPAQ